MPKTRSKNIKTNSEELVRALKNENGAYEAEPTYFSELSTRFSEMAAMTREESGIIIASRYLGTKSKAKKGDYIQGVIYAAPNALKGNTGGAYLATTASKGGEFISGLGEDILKIHRVANPEGETLIDVINDLMPKIPGMNEFDPEKDFKQEDKFWTMSNDKIIQIGMEHAKGKDLHLRWRLKHYDSLFRKDLVETVGYNGGLEISI